MATNTPHRTARIDLEALYRGPDLDFSSLYLHPVIVDRTPALVSVAPARKGECCADAVRVPCVCSVSYRCATHGSTCIGSHD